MKNRSDYIHCTQKDKEKYEEQKINNLLDLFSCLEYRVKVLEEILVKKNGKD